MYSLALRAFTVDVDLDYCCQSLSRGLWEHTSELAIRGGEIYRGWVGRRHDPGVMTTKEEYMVGGECRGYDARQGKTAPFRMRGSPSGL